MYQNRKRIIIGHVISALGRGGMEFAVARLAMEQKKMGCNVHVFCIRELGPTKERLEKAGVPIHLCPFRSRVHPASLLALKNKFKEIGVNVVQTHNYRPNVSGVVAAWLAGVPAVIASLRTVNRWDTLRQYWMDRIMCRFRDAIVCVSSEVRDRYHEKIKCPVEKLHVIYNGIDSWRFEERDKCIRLFEKHHLDHDAFYIIMIARLVEIKDHYTLLKSMKEICSRIPEARLILLGDGGLREDLKNLADELGIRDAVHFMGHCDNTAEWLSISHVSVLSTRVEGFSSTILESMASGTPVIATAVGGNLEAIEDGVTGFLVPPADSGAIARRVHDLYKDKDLYQKIAANGKAIVAKNFTIRATAGKTLDLYKRILRAKGIIVED